MDVRDKPKEFPEQSCVAVVKYIPNFGLFCKDKKSSVYKQAIMLNPQYAYAYARNVIDGRWPEAEPYIMQNPQYAYYYAREIIKGRWPQAELYIMRKPQWAYAYARGVIKDRWPQAEPKILNSSYADNYKQRFGLE